MGSGSPARTTRSRSRDSGGESTPAPDQAHGPARSRARGPDQSSAAVDQSFGTRDTASDKAVAEGDELEQIQLSGQVAYGSFRSDVRPQPTIGGPAGRRTGSDGSGCRPLGSPDRPARSGGSPTGAAPPLPRAAPPCGGSPSPSVARSAGRPPPAAGGFGSSAGRRRRCETAERTRGDVRSRSRETPTLGLGPGEGLRRCPAPDRRLGNALMAHHRGGSPIERLWVVHRPRRRPRSRPAHFARTWWLINRHFGHRP